MCDSRENDTGVPQERLFAFNTRVPAFAHAETNIQSDGYTFLGKNHHKETLFTKHVAELRVARGKHAPDRRIRHPQRVRARSRRI